MSIDDLLSRFEGVRRSGEGRWVARCPAHEDRSPSLGIRELVDGRRLILCRAGCDVESVLAGARLTFEDLFPEKPLAGDRQPRERRPFPAEDVLACMASEALVVATASANIRQGVALSDADHERLMLAAERLSAAAKLAAGAP